MRKILLISVSVFILILLLIWFYPGLVLRIKFPVYAGETSLPGLRAEVEVLYDDYAVPHVYADNEHDLFFTAGYLMASERLFQMDMVNRAAQGRLAEMSAGLVDADIYLRTWGFYRIGEALADRMTPEAKEIFQWACDGINTYIEEHRDNLPVEFRVVGHEPLAWTPVVMAAYARLMAHELNLAWNTELFYSLLAAHLDSALVRDVLPVYPGEAPTIAMRSPEDAHNSAAALAQTEDRLRNLLGVVPGMVGSNNWVVSGDRTETGKPILANDPHLGYVQPTKWIEMHLVGGRFNIRGLFLPGIPLAVLGNNEHVAWALTNVMLDDADFFAEEVDPGDTTRYRYKGEWRPFVTHEETIQVKDGEPATITVRESVHGVIINDIHPLAPYFDDPIAMRWTGQDIVDLPTAIMGMNLAQDWDEFRNAIRGFNVPGQNVVFADKTGDIAWRPMVQVPIRKDGEQPYIKPGHSGEYDWQGYIPFEDMPELHNPDDGFIITANNKTINDDYPHYFSIYWADPSRASRIREMLLAKDMHNAESFTAIQNDVLSHFAQSVLPRLLTALDGSQGNRRSAEALNRLHAWDYRVTDESVASTIFHKWIMTLFEEITRDEMDSVSPLAYPYYLKSYYTMRLNLLAWLERSNTPWADDINTKEVENLGQIINRSFGKTLDQLAKEFGSKVSRWRWNRAHTLTHPHDLGGAGFLGTFLNGWLGLNAGPYPTDGSGTTIDAQAHDLGNDFKVVSGPSMRAIYDLDNLDRSFLVLPTGQSGHPFSPHYTDQAELFNAGEYRQVAFSRDAVDLAGTRRLVLTPR